MVTTHIQSPITSVTTSEGESGGTAGCLLLICFVIFFVLSFMILGAAATHVGFIRDGEHVPLVALAGVVIAAFATMIIRKKPHSIYHIHMRMADMREVQLTYQDLEYRWKVLRAINDAIAGRE